MENKNENMTGKLSDQQLEDVAGGIGGTGMLRAIVTTDLKYESGATPKYSVNQKLKIKVADICSDAFSTFVYCTVIAVSEKANYGIIYEEFGYTVRMHTTPELINRGIQETYEGVYESALYEL